MANTAEGQIICPHCGAAFRWKPKLAGRKVECKCGQVMRAPDSPTGQATPVGPPPKPESKDDDFTYDLDLPEEEQENEARAEAKAVVASVNEAGRCPSCNQPVKPGAVLCVKCGFNIKEGKKLETKVAAGDAAAPAGGPKPAGGQAPALTAALPDAGALGRAQRDAEMAAEAERQHRIQEVYTPLGLVGLGVVLALINALVLAPAGFDAGPWSGMRSRGEITLFSIINTAVRLVVQFPFLLVSIFLVARLFGTSFGTLGTALLKLLALALVVGTVNDSVGHGLDIITGGFGGLGWMIEFAIVFGIFFTLCSVLFDMEPLECLVMYLLMAFLPFFAMVFIGGMIASMFF